MLKRSFHSEPADDTAHRRTPRTLVASGLLVIAVTYGLTRYGFGLYLPQFRADLGLSSGVAGGIAASSYLAYCVAAVVGLRLVDRGRARAALWVAGLSAAAGSLVVAGAWATPVLAIGALVAGSGAGAASPALVAAVAGTVPPSTEPRSQAVVNSGTGAGVLLGGLVVLAWPAEWRSAWLGFAGSALLLTWWADRSTSWGSSPDDGDRPGTGFRPRRLAPALAAALLAGAGAAGVWTFGRDVMTASGLPAQVTALLWCLFGGAALLGGLSGSLVRTAGLPVAWVASVGVTAAGTALLAWRPGSAVVAAAALALFGSGFVAVSGVLIAWGSRLAPEAGAQATAVLFVALTIGQAAGAVLLGVLTGAVGTSAAFVTAACLVSAAAIAAPRRGRPPAQARPLGARSPAQQSLPGR
ncbi:MFS transporter [Modestobacter sp. I12A-02662]|uniref:MFS transporter n=1 Tax=Modestobacter sp. I12A-02662 TaxID=1730496 RepID=UPI0034DFA7B6